MAASIQLRHFPNKKEALDYIKFSRITKYQLFYNPGGTVSVEFEQPSRHVEWDPSEYRWMTDAEATWRLHQLMKQKLEITPVFKHEPEGAELSAADALLKKLR